MEAIFQTLTSSQAFWVFIAIFTGVALLMCAVGFKKFVWFLSVGYGLAVVGLGTVKSFSLIGNDNEDAFNK